MMEKSLAHGPGAVTKVGRAGNLDMHMNVFSVHLQMETFDLATQMFGDTMAKYSNGVDGFRGMLGMMNRESGEALSIILNDDEESIASARETDLNRNEIERYTHLFRTEPVRDVYRVEARYMPMNRPFPGDSVFYARATSGFVRPRHVRKAIALSRDSMIFAAISSPGCCGYFLCANHATGKILGISMWDSIDNLQRSESERGYFHREMAKSEDLRVGPYEHQSFEIFARLMPK